MHWDDLTSDKYIGRATYLSPNHRVIHAHPSMNKFFASHVNARALRFLVKNTLTRMQRFKVENCPERLPSAVVVRDF